VFSSLHTSVGLAFVGAVVGEYLGSARGVGYLICRPRARSTVNTVSRGSLVLQLSRSVLDGLVGRIEEAADEVAAAAGRNGKLLAALKRSSGHP